MVLLNMLYCLSCICVLLAKCNDTRVFTWLTIEQISNAICKYQKCSLKYLQSSRKGQSSHFGLIGVH